MSRKRKYDSRDSGGFAAIPWSVIDSTAYKELSLPAKALLIEAARQYHRDDNGRMLLSKAYLATRGWKSSDVLHRAKQELLEAGFIYQTVQGHRPNKASWYACTWWTLDRLQGYDEGAVEGFVRSAYLRQQRPTIVGAPLKKPTPKPKPKSPPTALNVVPLRAYH